VQYVGKNIRKYLYTVLSSIGVVFLMSIFANCICPACILVILCVIVVPYVYVFFLTCICCILCVFVVPYVYLLCYVCTAVLTLDAVLLVTSQYPEGPATGHLDAGFSWFPCVYKRMLRWFPSSQVATTCLSCSLPDLNFLVTFLYLCTCKITTATG
jgi:ABC-type polysaccharide/polyol phosphate export permease